MTLTLNKVITLQNKIVFSYKEREEALDLLGRHVVSHVRSYSDIYNWGGFSVGIKVKKTKGKKPTKFFMGAEEIDLNGLNKKNALATLRSLFENFGHEKKISDSAECVVEGFTMQLIKEVY